MKPLADFVWALAPLVALLSRLGGWYAPSFRRIGIPLAIVLFALWRFRFRDGANKWVYFGVFVLGWAAFSLPLTLIGGEVSGTLINWVWLWLLGAFHALALVPLFTLHRDWDLPSLRWGTGFLVYVTVFGVLSTASNAMGFPVHAWFEIITGLVYGGVAAWIIGEEEQA